MILKVVTNPRKVQHDGNVKQLEQRGGTNARQLKQLRRMYAGRDDDFTSGIDCLTSCICTSSKLKTVSMADLAQCTSHYLYTSNSQTRRCVSTVD